MSTPTYRTVWREADILDFFCAPLQLLTTVTWGHTWTDRALLLWIPGLLWHKRTRIPPWPPVTHTRLHSQRTLTFTLVRGHTPPLPSPRPFKIHNHHSLCKIHTHHVCSATLYPQPLCPTCTHTHTHTPTLSHTRTHFSEGPSSYCPSIWLVPFVPHVLSVAAEKLLWAGGAVRPHDGGACPDLWKTFVVT